MRKTILITGATDGIGLETAKELASQGHTLLLHGRNPAKLEKARMAIAGQASAAASETYLADLSRMQDVEKLARDVAGRHTQLDVLINNAGILRTAEPTTADGLDLRFVVNTLAPYLLTQRLLPLLGKGARIVNLSSAAQSPVDPDALTGQVQISEDLKACAQSKLAITMWSRHLALALGNEGPMVVAVNPGSLLATKMVQEGFGMAGNDVRIGSDILVRAALSKEFENASGLYFDNDKKRFDQPHPDALDDAQCAKLVDALEGLLRRLPVA